MEYGKQPLPEKFPMSRSARAMVLSSLLIFLTTMPLSVVAGPLKADDIPLAARVVLTKAAELMARKSYDRALKVLTAFQAKGKANASTGRDDPRGYHHPAIYYYLGNCRLFQKDYAAAEQAYAAAVKRDPAFVEAWINLAKTHYEQSAFDQAAPCFLAAYERSDQCAPEHLYFCAVSYLMAGQYKASIDIFEKLFQRHLDRIIASWREHFVQALIADDQNRRALPLVRSLAEDEKGENQAKWQEVLLYQLLQLDMPSEALAYATELTRCECTQPKWWKALAHIELSGGCAEKALAALTIYSYLTPMTEAEQKLWADLNLQLDIPLKAIEQYQTLLQAGPTPEVLKNLVAAYKRLDRFQEGLDLLNYYAPDTDKTELLFLKADLLYGLKHYAQAGRLYRRVAESRTIHPGQAWLMAGYAAWQDNDFKAGRDAFLKAAEHRRYHKAAQRALRQLGHIH